MFRLNPLQRFSHLKIYYFNSIVFMAITHIAFGKLTVIKRIQIEKSTLMFKFLVYLILCRKRLRWTTIEAGQESFQSYCNTYLVLT